MAAALLHFIVNMTWFQLFLILWTIFGSIVFVPACQHGSWSFKQTVVAVILGGPLVIFVGIIVLIMCAFQMFWDSLA